MKKFRGLTWDHPRGYQALEAATSLKNGPIDWDRQPLSGFEIAPIAELCAQFDIVVLDHPHLGEALASDCLQPLDAIFSRSVLAKWQRQSVGRSFDSYLMDGHLWAIPLDAAAQVTACRSEMRDHVPATWEEVLTFAKESGRVALSLQGPHAVLTAFSIYASMGCQLGETRLFNEDAEAVFDLLSKIYTYAPQGSDSLNPIELLEAIQTRDQIDLCPLVFGYVNYAQGNPSRALHFANAPVWQLGGAHGSVIGGTGLALSKKCRPTPELLTHLRWLLSSEAQNCFIPDQAGQPSALSAWQDTAINTQARGFYRDTLLTMQKATIRPRFNGYIPFQSAASEVIRKGLEARIEPSAFVEKINALHQQFQKLTCNN